MRYTFLTIPFALLFLACGNGGDSAGGPPKGARSGKPGGKGQAEAAVTVATQVVARGTISTYYRATASLEANNEAEVTARVSGVVSEVLAEEGDFVQKGRRLLRIEPAEYALRVQQAESEAKKQRTLFERKQKMFERSLVSAEDFHSAENDFQSAEASLALARLELSYTNVTAPFGGQVVRRMTDIGRNVSSGDPLFAVADLEPLVARIHVPAKEFRQLETGQTVELILDSNRQTLRGVISLISPVIDPSTGTIKVTVEIAEYPDQTRPGDFAEVGIVTEEHVDALLVPKIAVVTEKEERAVYVAADSTAERRLVEVGFENDENSEILSGIEAGEEIVVQGQRSLKDGATIRVLEAITFDSEEKPRDPSAG